MDNKEKHENKIVWSPEWEQRYQYVEKQYDNARGIGIDVLKLLLSTSIVIAGVPIVFAEKVKEIFSGKELCFIYGAWVLILLAIFFGFLAFLFVFEGYYHRAHKEAIRHLSGDAEQIQKYDKIYNKFLDKAHYCAIFVSVLFGLSILCMAAPIGSKLVRLGCSTHTTPKGSIQQVKQASAAIADASNQKPKLLKNT